MHLAGQNSRRFRMACPKKEHPLIPRGIRSDDVDLAMTLPGFRGTRRSNITNSARGPLATRGLSQISTLVVLLRASEQLDGRDSNHTVHSLNRLRMTGLKFGCDARELTCRDEWHNSHISLKQSCNGHHHRVSGFGNALEVTVASCAIGSDNLTESKVDLRTVLPKAFRCYSCWERDDAGQQTWLPRRVTKGLASRQVDCAAHASQSKFDSSYLES